MPRRTRAAAVCCSALAPVLFALTPALAGTTGSVRGTEWRNHALVTPPPVDTRHAHDILTNPISGRLWYGRDFIGGERPRALPRVTREPGPHAYGAHAHAERLILVRVGHSIVGIHPFARIDGTGSLQTLEGARAQWLQENGYSGGVRTFVNPLHRDNYLNSPAGRRHAAPRAHAHPHAGADTRRAEKPSGEIRPRATIEIPPEMPRFEPRMRVLGPDATGDRHEIRVTRLTPGPAPAGVLTRLD